VEVAQMCFGYLMCYKLYNSVPYISDHPHRRFQFCSLSKVLCTKRNDNIIWLY